MSRGILQSIPTWMVSLALLLSATTNVNQQLFYSFMLSLGLALYSLELDNSCRLPDACKLCVCVCVCLCTFACLDMYTHAYAWHMNVRECVCLFLWPCAQERPTRERGTTTIYLHGANFAIVITVRFAALRPQVARAPFAKARNCTRNLFLCDKNK